MVDRVLGHLARRFAPSEENIASEALAWVLHRSVAARAALVDLGRAAGPDLPAELHFVGQVGDSSTGRPDLVGYDPERRERLIVEAKFAAALTAQQPNGYLSRLEPEHPGVLLVVAPSARRASLWSELLRALPRGEATAPAPSNVPAAGLLHLQVSPGRFLALTSWRHLVTLVLDAVRADGDRDLSQDVEQLLALTEEMDASAHLPLREGDLDLRTGKQVHQLARLVDDVDARIAGTQSLTRYSRSPSHGRVFYGWYVRTAIGGKRFWYGFLPRAWASHGVGPLWVQVDAAGAWSRQLLLQALAPFNSDGANGLYEDGESFLLPLRVPLHAGREQAVQGLLDQLLAVAAALESVAPAGVAPVDELAVPAEEVSDLGGPGEDGPVVGA